MEYLPQLVTEGYRWRWTRCTSSLQRNWCRVEGDGLRSGVCDFYLQSKGRNEPLTPVAVGVLVPLLKVWVWIHHSVSFGLSLNTVYFIWITFFTCCVFWFCGALSCFNGDFWCSHKVLLVVGAPGSEDERKADAVCVSVGWLWENCWGSYLNLSSGSSRVCRCLRSDGGLREIGSRYSLLDLLACGLLQSGQIRTFLWSTALMTHARPFGLITSVQMCRERASLNAPLVSNLTCFCTCEC